MKNFSSFGEMALELAAVQVGLYATLHKGLDVAATLIEKRMKSVLGEYQPAVGDYPAWDPLAEATQARRVALGYTPDDPLLMSGALKESIEHQTDALAAEIGTNADQAAYLEFGTSKMPPRPFAGPAEFTTRDAVRAIIGMVGVSAFVGEGGARVWMGELE